MDYKDTARAEYDRVLDTLVSVARGDYPYRQRRKASLLAKSMPDGYDTPNAFDKWRLANRAALATYGV